MHSGNGVAGIVLPESEEKVLAIKEGDALALPFGVVNWWYNKEDTELVVLFLGDTSKAHKSGEFTNFYLTGSNGIFTGFSTEFVGRAWDLEEKDVKTIVGSQSGNGIVKLDGSIKLPEPNPAHRNGMALNCLEAPLDVDIKDGGRVVVPHSISGTQLVCTNVVHYYTHSLHSSAPPLQLNFTA